MCPRVNKSKSPEQCQPVQFTIQWSRKLSFVCKANLGCQWSHGRSIRARTHPRTHAIHHHLVPPKDNQCLSEIFEENHARSFVYLLCVGVTLIEIRSLCTFLNFIRDANLALPWPLYFCTSFSADVSLKSKSPRCNASLSAVYKFKAIFFCCNVTNNDQTRRTFFFPSFSIKCFAMRISLEMAVNALYAVHWIDP